MRRTSSIPAAMACTLLLALAAGAANAAPDEEAARTLARQSNCFKCHGVTKEKDGPSWHEVAVKYKGKPDAQARLTKHLTTGETAKFPDGHTEEHPVVKTKDQAQIKNLVDWILSL